MTHPTIVTMLACALSASGLALAGNKNEPLSKQPTAAAAAHVKIDDVKIPTSEDAYLQKISAGLEHQVALGRLAKARARAAEVRQHGEMSAREQQGVLEQLTQYANTKGLALRPTAPPSDKAQVMASAKEATQKKLSILEGTPFDQAFLATLIGAQDGLQGKLQAGLSHFRTPELASILRNASLQLVKLREQTYALLGQHKPRVSAALRTLDLNLEGYGGAGEP